MHKSVGNFGLADAIVAERRSGRAWLEDIDQRVDWTFVDSHLSQIYSARTGRPSYPPLVLFKALLIGAWFNLSDPGLEAALDDSLSFRRFCGLSLSDTVPDHSTLCRFRQKLEASGCSTTVFEGVTRQLEGAGLSIRKGTLVDASLVKANAARPPKSKGLGAGGDVDKDANWTRKGGKSVYGYKMHIAVDQDTCLVRRAILTPAKTADSLLLDDLIMGDERALYADRGYEHKARRLRIRARGIKDRIMHRASKHNPQLSHWKAKRNALISPIRCQVEKLFGTLKRHYGFERVRFMSLARNEVDLHVRCLAMNMKRALVLSRQS